MTYQRMRRRNGLRRKPAHDPDPYFREDSGRTVSWGLVAGDLNRMERDYLRPEYPQPPFAQRRPDSDPSAVCAKALGLDVETVRQVLDYVFSGRDDGY